MCLSACRMHVARSLCLGAVIGSVLLLGPIHADLGIDLSGRIDTASLSIIYGFGS